MSAWTGTEAVFWAGSNLERNFAYSAAAAYDPTQGAWRDVDEPGWGHPGLVGAVLDGVLYASAKGSVGRFDFDTGDWVELPSIDGIELRSIAAGDGTLWGLDERGVGMRATWHPGHGFINVSLWRDDRCVETFHLTPDAASDLIAFVIRASHRACRNHHKSRCGWSGTPEGKTPAIEIHAPSGPDCDTDSPTTSTPSRAGCADSQHSGGLGGLTTVAPAPSVPSPIDREEARHGVRSGTPSGPR